MGNIFDANYNFWFITFLIMSGIGVYWLLGLGVQAGIMYAMLLALSFVLYLASISFLKEKNSEYGFVIPINKSNTGAAFLFLAGFFVIVIFATFSSLTGSNFYNPAVTSPLNSFASEGGETFSVLSAQNSPFWTMFIVTFTAPVVEEFVLGFLFVFLGMLVAYAIRKALGLDFGSTGNVWFQFLFGVILSVVLFAGLHFFNDSYLNPDGTLNMSLFMSAAIFRLMLNILMFPVLLGKWALGLMFGIGVHMANNVYAIGWIGREGGPPGFIDGLFDGWGFAILAFLALLVFMVIRSLNNFRLNDMFEVGD